MGVHIEKFTFNPFQENTYIVHDGSSCIIIDPGCYERQEEQTLLAYIHDNKLEPKALLLTHAHIDHVLGCHFLLEQFDIDFYVHEADLDTLQSVAGYAHLYGFPGYQPPRDPNIFLKGGERLEFGSIHLDVFFTPGHCSGHVVYLIEELGAVINGDVLFAGSFGRVDLPGGDINTLKQSIFEVMFNLPDDTVIYCGHGAETTIGAEKRSNYILQF